MVFSSLSFLVVFLPVLAVLYFVLPAKWKHAKQYLLLAFSLLFYGAGEPLYIFLILFCVTVTWILSEYVSRRRRWALVVSILINIIPLVITKYAGFIIANFSVLTGTAIPFPEIPMPIGISFYTFQVITYIADLYRGKFKKQRNPLLFALYIMFFAQLIAGPIVKYSEVMEQLEKPDVSWDNVKYGIGRLIFGLGKKVLIANQAGYIASSILKASPGSVNTGMTYLCVIAFSIQLYFDFSGYSEMAIGLGSIFGFHFPENFKDPYISCSISEFWQRWHITLGRFFREYVYIPLGGNRVSRLRWLLNIVIVWALTGLWHGAAWNYVLWGLYYGVLIVFEKITRLDRRLPKFPAWLLTLFLIIFGMAIFMSDGQPAAVILKVLGKMFFLQGEIVNPVTISSLKLWRYIPYLLLGVILSLPPYVALRSRFLASRLAGTTVFCILSDLLKIAILLVSLMFLIGGTYNPFIYFRF